MLCGLALWAQVGAAGACELLPLVPLGAGLWWVPAAGADSDAANRGHAAHVLLARQGGRLWALGAGPTPAWGARLACTARRQLGRAVDDVVVPWAQAELALGLRGVGAARSWAHAQVADAMHEQCPHCVDRLRQRLGPAAADLGDDPAQQPARRFTGAQGRLGPFDWWALPRSADRVATVWRHRASGVTFAPGLLWGDGPPDLRDTDVALFARSLQALLAGLPPATRWVGQTGALLDAAQLRAQLAYVQALQAAAVQALEAGQLSAAAPALSASADVLPAPGVAERHALNWQRVWRQAEDDWLRAGR